MIGQILWPAVFAYAIWRFAPIAERFAPVPLGKTTPAQVVLPDDIIAWASEQSEPWAQDEHLQVAREKYLSVGQVWNKTRRALGIGVMS